MQGSQCDLLPLTSETNVSIRGNDCSWNGNFQASLSIDYTLNGPFIIPSDQLDQIWCDGNLQPIIGSEDNYTVDFVRMEVYYTCDEPNGVSDLVASSNQFCDHVQLSWNGDLSDQYNLYRDGFMAASGIASNMYTDTGFGNTGTSNQSNIDTNQGTGTSGTHPINLLMYLYNFNSSSEYSYVIYENAHRNTSQNRTGGFLVQVF